MDLAASPLDRSLLALPALWAAGLALHLLGWATYAGVAGAIVTAFVAAGAHLKWDRPAEQWYARLTAAGFSVWLWLAALAGPLRPGWLGVPWVSAALAAVVAGWGVPWYRHKRPRGTRRRQKKIAAWDAWWQSHCWHWNLGGSKVGEVWEMGVTTKVRVHGIAGRHTIRHVEQVMHLIESGLEGFADIGMVRAEAVKGHPNWFDFYFKRENPLREIVEFDLALAPKSVHEMAPLVMTESGSWRMASLRVNSFVIGATRTGKSNHLLVRLASLTGCADDWQILIDLKGGRSARPVLEAAAVAHVVTELDEARMTLRMLVAESKARAKYAYAGEEQLHATMEVPALHLLIDEVHGLTSVANGDTECARQLALVASLGNGLEVYTEIYTQHGSLEESVRTEQTRGNLPLRVVYRVEEARHGAYVIPEYSKLDASKLEEKGTCYVKDGPKALPEQGRAPHMPHGLLKKVAAQNAALIAGRPPLRLYCGGEVAYQTDDGPVTWQQWWDTRWLRLDPAFHAISPQYQAAVAASPALAFAAVKAAAPTEPAPSREPGDGDAKAAAARIAAELDEVHRGVPAGYRPPKANLSPVITRQKDAFATALESAPDQGVSPTQLIEESGRSSSWVYAMLRSLVEIGAVTQLGRGRYQPAAGEDIREAMRAIDAGNEALYREARATVNAA